jgi:hypothetical protein
MRAASWVVLTVLLGSCGKSTPEPSPSSSGSAGEQSGAGSAAGKSDAPPAPIAEARLAKPAPPKLLTPDGVDPDTPMPVAELRAALDPWKRGTRLVLAGYPTFFIGTKGPVRTKLELVAEPGGTRDTPALAHCYPAEPDPTEVTNTDPVVIEGKLNGVWGKDDKRYLWISDCKLVERGKPFDPDAPADPRSGTPIPVAKAHAVIVGWLGTEVTATGYFQGITTSSSNDGKVIDVRVDLAASGDKVLDIQLGCHLPKDKPDPAFVDKLGAQRAETIVRGKVAPEAFGKPQLDPCTIVNR